MIHSSVNDLAQMVRMLMIEETEIVSELVWDEKLPEVIFVSEQIYLLKRQHDDFVRLYCADNTKRKIFVMFSAEAVYPDLNLFDYIISFDRQIESERYNRIPIWKFYGNSVLHRENTLSEEIAHKMFHEKKFCNFLYSNGNAHEMRDKLYLALGTYKKVDSLGKWKHDTDILEMDRCNDWRIEAIKVKKHYRFSIACENAIFPGYTSEKILSSFQAHSIPIYWGNPVLKYDYNEEAIIYVNDFSSAEELVDRVAEIDSCEEKWVSIVTKPWRTIEQIETSNREFENYKRFVANILINKEICRPLGYWNDIYKKFWLK